MENPELLKILGLSTYEARAYLSLLSIGIADANAISSKAEIPTGRIYDVLNSLTEMNLIEIQDSRPKQFKAVEPRVAMKRLLSQRKKELDGRFEQLTRAAISLENSISRKEKTASPHASTFWNIAVGQRDIHRVFEKRIAEAEEEILMYLELERYDPYDEPMFGEMLRALERGVDVKILLGSRDAGSLRNLGFSPVIARLKPFFGL